MQKKYYRVGYYDTEELTLNSDHYNYGKSFNNQYNHFVENYFKIITEIDLPVDFLINVNDNLAMFGNTFLHQKISPAIINECFIDIERVTGNPKHKNAIIPIILLNKFIQSFDDNNPFEVFKEGKYIWERYFEMVRLKIFPDLPQRQQSIFLFGNIDDCKYYRNTHKGGNGNIYEVELLNTKSLYKGDMKIFDNIDISITFNNLILELYKYWDSKSSDIPVYEYLFQGKCKLKRIES